MKRGFIFWTAAILGVIALSCSGSDSNSGSSDNGSSDNPPSKSGSKTETVTIYQHEILPHNPTLNGSLVFLKIHPNLYNRLRTSLILNRITFIINLSQGFLCSTILFKLK